MATQGAIFSGVFATVLGALAKSQYDKASLLNQAAQTDTFDPARHTAGDFVCISGPIVSYEAWPIPLGSHLKSVVAEVQRPFLLTQFLESLRLSESMRYAGNVFLGDPKRKPVVRLEMIAGRLPMKRFGMSSSFRLDRLFGGYIPVNETMTVWGTLSYRDRASVTHYEQLLAEHAPEAQPYDPYKIMCIDPDASPARGAGSFTAGFGSPEQVVADVRKVGDVCCAGAVLSGAALLACLYVGFKNGEF